MIQAEKGEPMTIVGDGKQRRDFTYIKDVVNANILALKSTNEKIYGEVINIGTGINHSMIEIAEMIGGEYIHMPARRGEVFETHANNNKALDLLGWQPTMRLHEWIIKNNRQFINKF
jgi:UDP-glucose 4-epimerase